MPGEEYDQLLVSGTVEIEGTVVPRFIDGYAPTAGQEFDALLDVQRTADVSAADFTVQNLAPGFEFDITPMDGGFMFTALTDGMSA